MVSVVPAAVVEAELKEVLVQETPVSERL